MVVIHYMGRKNKEKIKNKNRVNKKKKFLAIVDCAIKKFYVEYQMAP